MLERDYKFYLAFENSVCVDYVTEKFWNALAFNVLPVVLGGADYQHMVPNTSYIDVRNFKSGMLTIHVKSDPLIALNLSRGQWKIWPSI